MANVMRWFDLVCSFGRLFCLAFKDQFSIQTDFIAATDCEHRHHHLRRSSALTLQVNDLLVGVTRWEINNRLVTRSANAARYSCAYSLHHSMRRLRRMVGSATAFSEKKIKINGRRQNVENIRFQFILLLFNGLTHSQGVCQKPLESIPSNWNAMLGGGMQREKKNPIIKAFRCTSTILSTSVTWKVKERLESRMQSLPPSPALSPLQSDFNWKILVTNQVKLCAAQCLSYNLSATIYVSRRRSILVCCGAPVPPKEILILCADNVGRRALLAIRFFSFAVKHETRFTLSPQHFLAKKESDSAPMSAECALTYTQDWNSTRED